MHSNIDKTAFDFSSAEIILNRLGKQRNHLKSHPFYLADQSISFECAYKEVSNVMDEFYKAHYLKKSKISFLNTIESILLRKINYLLNEGLLSLTEGKLLAEQICRIEQKTPSSQLMNALDLHPSKKSLYMTHSTWLADRSAKRKTSLALSALLDSSPKCVMSVELSKEFDNETQLSNAQIKPVYSEIISKFFRQQDNDAVFQQVSSGFTFVDPVAIERSAKQHDMILRIWFSTVDHQMTSRLLYISSNHTAKSVTLYYQMFGNIDLAIIPVKEDITHEVNITWYEKNQLDKIAQIPATCLITIAKYLDHGQSLNLKTLDTLHKTESLKNHLLHHTEKTTQQPIEDFYYNYNYAPNGHALLKKQVFQYIAHMSRFKKEIIESGIISTSNGGCLGNVIYSIKILENAAGQRYMPGMSLGLAARLFTTKNLETNKLFLFRVNEEGNSLTNWINSLGFGRLKLESLLSVADSSKYMPHINKVCAASMMLYHRLIPILQYFKQYSLHRSFNCFLSEERQHEFITSEFNQFWSLFCSTRALPHNRYHLTTFYLLNNLLFEVLKDYILLHQKTKDQDIFNSFGSYDMHNQYEFFFNLDPDLRNKGFKTEVFSPDYFQILDQLEVHQAIDISQIEEIIAFKKFMLDRFSAAINQFYLENNQLSVKPWMSDITKSNAIYPFMELASTFPNLMGNIFHGILTKTSISSEVEKSLIQEYHAKLRELFGLSYDERNIKVPIKTNLFETDEVGARQINTTTVHDLVLKKTSEALFEVLDISAPYPIKIQGVSTRVQLRTEECEDKNQLNLRLVAQLFTKPIEEWSLDAINQFDTLFGNEIYTISQIEELGILHHLQAITQSIFQRNGQLQIALNRPQMISFQLKLTQLILETFTLLNIKSFDLACEKLHTFSLEHKILHHDLIVLLLDNKKQAGPLYLASILFFVSRYYLISEPLNKEYVKTTLDLSALIEASSHIKTKTIYAQLLINLRKKNLIRESRLIMSLLSDLQKILGDNYHYRLTTIRIAGLN